MIQSLYNVFKSFKESLDFTRPVYSKDLYMDGKKLNFIDYNKTYMKKELYKKLDEQKEQAQVELQKQCEDHIKELQETNNKYLEYMKKDKFVKITKEQLDFLKQYGIVVHNDYYNYYHLPQIFAVSDKKPEEMHITKSFDELHPTVLKMFRSIGIFNKEESYKSESEKESTNYDPIYNEMTLGDISRNDISIVTKGENGVYITLRNKNKFFCPNVTVDDVKNNFDNLSNKIIEFYNYHKENSKSDHISLEINKYCLDIASKLPNTCLKELFDNANKIKEYLEGK